jgi:hypothetical protein
MKIFLNDNIDSVVLDLVKKTELYFLKICDQVELPDKWSADNSFEIEIKKSFIRGLLRYSKESPNIASCIKNKFRISFPDRSDINWITIPYPMIHLPFDRAEDGGFHFDGCDNKLFTCWIPITDYRYLALSLVKFNNLFTNFFSKILIKSKLCKVISNNLKAIQGNFFFWNGNTIHAGNFNTSSKVSCAIQLKLTNDIYSYEQVKNFNNFSILNSDNTFYNLSEYEIKKEFSFYKDYINSILFNENNNQNNNEYSSINDFTGFIKKKSLPLSFAFSVLAQRIISKKEIFRKFNLSERIITTMDIISLMLGSSNLASLRRLVERFGYRDNFEKILMSLDHLQSIPFNSYQVCKIFDRPIKDHHKNNHFSY